MRKDKTIKEQSITCNPWAIYNAEKRKLSALNLCPEEYETKIQKLAKELQL